MSRREIRQLGTEFFGTAVFSAGVIGAGLLVERFPAHVPLSPDGLVALTGAGFVVALMLTGGRFNPVLTLADVVLYRLKPESAAWRAGAQILGAIVGVMAAHTVFDMGAIQHGGRTVSGAGVWGSEAAATFVFVLAVGVSGRLGLRAMAIIAGVALGAVYLLSPAMSLANPALLLARTLTDSYLGLRPADAPILLFCQLAAVLAGMAVLNLATAIRRDAKL